MNPAILVALSCGFAVAAPVESVKDREKIQGTWEIVEFVIDGRPAPDALRKETRFQFKDDTMVMYSRDGKREFKFKLDPSKKPRALDVTAVGGPFDGQTNPAIYELSGDNLKLCLPNQTTKDRPAEFKSEKGSNLGYVVLKRARP
jgi:uncharacterized protein (TIGR03067 family)